MKTVIEMAREAGFDCAPDGRIYNSETTDSIPLDDEIQRFAELVRADEREALAKVCDELHPGLSTKRVAEIIRARGTNEA